MKNNPALEQWGHFDQKANEPNILKEPWRATSAGRNCSHNIQILSRLLTSCNHPSLSHSEWVISTKQVHVITDDMTMS